MSYVLVQEMEKGEKPIYFVSKVLRKLRYYNLEVEILFQRTPYHCQNQLSKQASLEEAELGRKNGSLGSRIVRV